MKKITWASLRLKRDISFFTLSIIFIFSSISYAQTDIGGVINSYERVVNITDGICVDSCDTSQACLDQVDVEDTSEFAVGDKVLIVQLKGATIDRTNTASAGQITSIGNAGNYEFFDIESITGNTIRPSSPLLRAYDTAGLIQLVRVPVYPGDVNVISQIIPIPWSDITAKGGIVALFVNGTLTFNLGTGINVKGAGYNGIEMTTDGSIDNCSIDPNNQYNLPETNDSSYFKGGGVAVSNNTNNKGRGPLGNGGGAGVSGDSGGGGGANFGSGGIGGSRWCDVDPSTGTPNTNYIIGGGLGGYALDSQYNDNRVFYGGAGGPGYVTSNNSSQASNGGGIIVIRALEVIGNNQIIDAAGNDAILASLTGTAADGGGGGGAGGSIAFDVRTFSDNLIIDVSGGSGQDLPTNVYHGPGGGGGGGVFLHNFQNLPANLTVLRNGGVAGTHTNGINNGSQSGQIGGIIPYYNFIETSNQDVGSNNDAITDFCDIDDDNDGIIDTVESGGNDPDKDEDGDLIPNWRDTIDNGNAGDGSTTDYGDSNGDGIPDVYDFDSDGVPNHFDLDSDNDGIPDNIEAQNTDSYIAPDPLDSDENGLSDVYESGMGNGLTPENSDIDTSPDYLDTDSDNDGLLDIIETGFILTGVYGINGLDSSRETTDDYSDANGNVNVNQVNSLRDTDSDEPLIDGDVDFRDKDSDNDGVEDGIDLDPLDPKICADSDNDGCDDCSQGGDGFGVAPDNDPANDGVDTDGDGICDDSDPDDDGDGVLDGVDRCPGFDDTADSDGDGYPDACDPDDDNDGILDADEKECSVLSNSEFFGSYETIDVPQIQTSVVTQKTPGIFPPFNISEESPLTVNYGQSTGKKLSKIIFSSGRSLDLDSDAEAGMVFLRRNTNPGSTPENLIFWSENQGNSTKAEALNLSISQQSTTEQILRNGYFNAGSDNIFANESSLSLNRSNVERVDVVFLNGIVSKNPDIEHFLFGERGRNSDMIVAAITSIGSDGIPTSYGLPRRISSATDYLDNTDITYTILRKTPSSPNFKPDQTGTQKVAVAYLNFTKFGVAANTTIYGYSIFPEDYDLGPGFNILDWNTYPIDTDDAVGGVDIVLLNNIYSSCSDRDTDADGIVDKFDTDSDNDGCFDALEGSENITSAQVNGQGRLTANGIDTNGIPNDANGGQTDVSSNNPAITGPNCDDDGDSVLNGTDRCAGFDDLVDTDNDSVPDGCDEDDDNDGILDVDENKCGATSIYAPFYTFNRDTDNITYDLSPDFDSGSVVNSASNLTVGAGLTLLPRDDVNDQSFLQFDSVEKSTLSEAISTQEYVEYSFTVNNSFAESVVVGFSENPLSGGVLPTQQYDHKIAILISNNNFASFGTILKQDYIIGSTPVGIVFTPMDVDYYLTPNGTYTVRVYLYDAPGPANSIATFDDFGFQIDNCTLSNDFDEDGLVNRFDLDSDNDGCFDALEGNDTTIESANLNGNGVINGGVNVITGIPTALTNVNGQGDVSSQDGTVSSPRCDDDKDGVTNQDDECPGFNDVVDSDGDDVANGCDLDSDNDGIADINEGCSTANIVGTIGNMSTPLPVGAGPSYSVNGVQIQYTRTNISGTSRVRGYNTSNTSGGNQGDAIRIGGNTNASGSLLTTFSEPVYNVRFKLTDFDDEEEFAVTVVDRLGNTYDLTVEGITSIGGQINQTGNSFTTIATAEVIGDISNSDNVGSIIFNFPNSVQSIFLEYAFDTPLPGASIRYTEVQFCTDSDADFTPNYLDFDSDNDGCNDANEAYNDPNADSNGDGTYGGVVGSTEVNNNGQVILADYSGTDPSVTDDTIFIACQDNDTDGIPDNLDPDDDNDGILDVVENGGGDPLADTDGDGILDYLDVGAANDANNDGVVDIYDFDGDGVINQFDLDSDNDGISDVVEAGGLDPDGDGTPGTGSPDTDGDGLVDAVDTDNGGTPLVAPNTDTAGNADYLDIDSDEDGIPDNIESQPSLGYVPPSGTDVDGDGLDDSYDGDDGRTLGTVDAISPALVPEDTDGTDGADYLDGDSDNDGVPDILENGDTDNAALGTDTDGDGLDDAFDDNDDSTDVGFTVNDGGNASATVTDVASLEESFDDSDNDFNPGTGDLDYRDIANPALTITKTIRVAGSTINDIIEYDIIVTNTGDIVLTDIEVIDANADGGIVVGSPITALAPGDTITVTASQTITEIDIIAGYIENSATAIGEIPGGDPTDPSDNITDVSDTDIDSNGTPVLNNETVETPNGDGTTDAITNNDPTVTLLNQISSLTLVKTATISGNREGDEITYIFTVRNTGNVSISSIQITDPLPGITIIGGPISLAPGEEDDATITGTYIISADDINAGMVMNQALVTGLDPSNNDITDISDNGDETIDDDGDGDPTNDPTIVELPMDINLALTKTGIYIDTNNDGFPNASDQISYTFIVENTGNVVINNIILTDPLIGVVIQGGPINLNPGDSDTETFTALYEITEDDILVGSITNQALVTGQDLFGNDVTDISDDPLNVTNVDTDDDGDFEDETITVIPIEDEIILYTGISPNDDGKNDTFRIVGLNKYPENILRIYNRWGVLVFEENNYESPGAKLFEGISNGRATIAEKDELPAGTYYYVLEYLNGSGVTRSNAGYLYINR